MSSSKSSDSRSSSDPSVDALTTVLLSVVDVLRTWSDEDLTAFLAGDRELTVRRRSRPSRQRSRDKELTPAKVQDVRAAFAAMNTREEGIEYLDQMALSRDSLRALVAALDLPANRSDNMEGLRNRIVEALIGYRLRSRAIRGQDRGA